ncbi:MAG: hypothetical protein IKY70_07805, partial [Bacteroidales bacterium]|nr:hypothetical protein [Bacteroidales bacterium]
MQTLIIKEIVKAASKKIDGKIDIGKVYFVFFNKIILQDVSIVSTEQSSHLDSLKRHFNQSDTLLHCGKLSVSLKSTDLMKFKASLNRIYIENGVFNLQKEGDEDGQTNLSRIFKLDPDKEKDTSKKALPLNLLANSLKIENFRFTLNNPLRYTHKGDSIINFNDLDVRNINVNINNVRLEEGTIYGKIRNISGRDKSGFAIRELRGNIEVNSTHASINNLLLADNYTEINANHFSMNYDSPKDFSEFVDRVKLEADLNNTYLNFKTIGRIAPSLYNSTLGLYLNGTVGGPVCDLRSRSIQVTSESGNTFMEINVRMTGLPNVEETMSVVEINNCYTTSNDISKIVGAINGNSGIPFFKRLHPGIRYRFKGSLIGLPDDFVAHGSLTSNVGAIDVDILLKNDNNLNGFVIKGGVESKDFDIGKVLSIPAVGELGMNGALSAIVTKRSGISLSIDSIRINRLGFNGYNYSDIYAVGKYNNRYFDGKIICHDPNLNFIFQGLLSFNLKEGSKYNFYADIPYANLAALNLDNRDSMSIMNFRTIANFNTTAQKDIFGNINVITAGYKNSSGNYNLGPVKLKSHAGKENYNITLTAPFMDAEFNGTAPATSFINKVIALSAYQHAGNLFSSESGKEKMNSFKYKEALRDGNEYDLQLKTYNTFALCQLLRPGLFIQENSRLNAHIDTSNRFDLNLTSGRIALGLNFFKDLNLNISDTDSLLNIDLESENIRLAGMKMDSSRFTIRGKENLFDAIFAFQNNSEERNKAYLGTTIKFEKEHFIFDIDSTSHIELKGNEWDFDPANIVLSDSTLLINNFKLKNGQQFFSANGLLSKERMDSLDIGLNKFDIRVFNLFLNRPFNVEGFFSGNARVSTFGNNSNMFLDITGDSVYVYNNPVGVMKIMSKWYQPEKRFNVLVNSKLDGRTNMTVTG